MKYKVYARYNVSKYIGEFEGDMPEDAIEAAELEEAGDEFIPICSRCAEELECDGIHRYEYFAECDW